MIKYIKNEIKLIKEKDPSITKNIEALIHPCFKIKLYYKLAHFLYLKKYYFLARFISEKCKRKTGCEIHPGAKIGNNFFIDHGCAIVIGETTIIGDNVVMFHGVTLGGIGNNKGKRHPTIEDNVLIGAGSIILGNITIGKNSKVGAGAIVLNDVKENTTVICEKAKEINNNFDLNKAVELLKYY